MIARGTFGGIGVALDPSNRLTDRLIDELAG